MVFLIFLACAGFSTPQPVAQNLAMYYLSHLETIQTPEQRNAAVLRCLAEIASILDKTASKRAIQVELAGRFKAMLMSVDSRDKDVKTQTQKLFDALNVLEAETTGAINETFSTVTGSLKAMRGNLLSKMGIALNGASRNANVSSGIEAKIADAVAAHSQGSVIEAITYFGIFQGLILISVYLLRKYTANKGLPL
jgi:hypothetical protein